MNPPHIPSTLSSTLKNMSDALVLITGTGRHLGFRILVSTLEAGHRVMAIVRDEEQLEKIARKPSVTPYRDQLTFALVKDKDLDAPRVFEHFMQEVTHVIHNASITVSPGPRAKKGDKPLVCMSHASPKREIELMHLAVDHGPTLLRPCAQGLDDSFGLSKQNTKCSPRCHHLERRHTRAGQKRVWLRS